MKKVRLFLLLLMAMVMPLAMFGQSTLTVNDGTATNGYVPVYGFYADAYLKCEYIIPATELESMGTGASISAMTFYLSTPATDSWGSANFQIFMKEVDATTISDFTGPDDATVVYEGSLDGTQSEMVVEFATNYTYNGGNLLVGVYNTVTGSYKSASFSGVEATGASVTGYSYTDLASVTSASQRNFLPKTTFTYSSGAPVACARPTGLTYDNLTSTSVDLSWTVGGSETAWTLSVNGTEMTGITTNPYTLTLSPNTDYTVKVKANCSATESSTWSNTVSFYTGMCIPAPSSIDNSGITNVTFGQNQVVNNSTHPTASPFYGDYTAQVGDGAAGTPVTVDITYGTGYTYGTVIWVNWNNDLEFTDDEVVFAGTSGSTNPTTFSCTFTIPASTPVGTYRMRIGGADSQFDTPISNGSGYNACMSTTYTIYEDYTLSVAEAPDCLAPAGVAVTNITSTSATIGWTANSGETEWTLEVNGTEMTGITENPYTLTGLTAATNYTVRVKANCSATEESDWTSAVSFFTACDVIAVTNENPYHEGFESSDWGCWSADIVSGTVNWTHSTSNVVEGTQTAYLNYAASEARLTSPILDLTALTAPQLTFSHRQAVWSGTVDELYVYYRTAPTEEWVELAAYTTTYASMTEETILLPDASATYQISFLGHCVDALSIYLDDVNVFAAPTCIAPSDVTVDAVTTTTATISWTDNNSTDPQGWTIDVNGNEVAAATNPFTLDNLTAATFYTVKVKANCADDDESAWSEELTFSTDCEVIVVTPDNPYQEGFENEGLCWNIEQVMGTYGWYTLESTNSYEGNAMAVCHYDPASESRLISPVLDITQLEEPTFTFQHHQAIYSNIVEDLHVYYRSSATEEWTLLASYTTEFADWTMETFSLPNPTATYQVAFLGHGNDGNFIWVDDINIFDNAAVPCGTPTNVAVENGVVTWTGDAANYNVHITVAGEVVIDTTVNTTSYTIVGLEEGAHASVAVQAVCAEDNLSEWSTAVEFDYITVGVNNYGINANIYPNPTTGNVTVESNAVNADITVFDMFGKLMMTSKVASERTELDFSSFAPGVYMIRIANTTGTTTIKVVKE